MNPARSAAFRRREIIELFVAFADHGQSHLDDFFVD